jgi:DNA-binding transcriptional LysR family regulator
MLSQIKAFVQVAQTGNVSRAAQAMFLSQPALTARIQSLERELGARLIQRTKYGVRLTDAGKAFLPFAERALATIDDGRRYVQALVSGAEGEVILAATESLSLYILPPLLKRFQADHPQVRISLRTGHSEDVLAMVVRGDVHVGVGRQIGHPQVDSTFLYEDQLLLVVSSEHPLADRSRVTPHDLETERLILFDPQSSYHGLMSALLRERGVTPRETFTVDNIETAKRMAERGLGASVLPRCAVSEEIKGGSLRSIQCIGVKFPPRRVVVMRRKDADESHAPATEFAASLLSQAAMIA